MAENESAARLAATQSHFDIFECAARKANFIDTAWNDSIPYNADDDRTCSEIMANNQPVAPREARQPAYAKTGLRAFDVDNRYIQSRRPA
jgi:hypothetical protein